MSIGELQHVLRPDELFLEFTLGNPRSYCIVVSQRTVRVAALARQQRIEDNARQLLREIRSGTRVASTSGMLGTLVLGSIPELETVRRLIISPDGLLNQVPFELLAGPSGKPLLRDHVVSYVPSGISLFALRTRHHSPAPRHVLAVAASPSAMHRSARSTLLRQVFGNRSLYDLPGGVLRPLPAADDEARAVASILGNGTLLLGASASEHRVKEEPLADYRVLHFAAHGIVSATFPAHSALLLMPGNGDDGLLEAREIVTLKLNADLVTLSACDSASNADDGNGPTSLVRAFLAAGADTVVANLWSADDIFSLALMKVFYAQLAAGVDKGEALRRAKLAMLKEFGPQALPRLWSGLLMYGDSIGTVTGTSLHN